MVFRQIKQAARGVLSMSACANINNAMQNLSGVSYETSDQQKDVMKARQLRDVKEIYWTSSTF